MSHIPTRQIYNRLEYTGTKHTKNKWARDTQPEPCEQRNQIGFDILQLNAIRTKYARKGLLSTVISTSWNTT